MFSWKRSLTQFHIITHYIALIWTFRIAVRYCICIVKFLLSCFRAIHIGFLETSICFEAILIVKGNVHSIVNKRFTSALTHNVLLIANGYTIAGMLPLDHVINKCLSFHSATHNRKKSCSVASSTNSLNEELSFVVMLLYSRINSL